VTEEKRKGERDDEEEGRERGESSICDPAVVLHGRDRAHLVTRSPDKE